MHKRKYVKVQIVQHGSQNYRIDILPVEDKNDGACQLDKYEKIAYEKSMGKIKDYLNRNNYNPEFNGQYSYECIKDIKRHSILFNNLKRIINHEFVWLNIYTVY